MIGGGYSTRSTVAGGGADSSRRSWRLPKFCSAAAQPATKLKFW
ncbi:unnamed protein product, partial [Allacma fusca]